jgi:hypothetical protein
LVIWYFWASKSTIPVSPAASVFSQFSPYAG